MGQYYDIIIKNVNGDAKKFKPKDDGFKLMEFSDFNANMVDIICNELYHETCKVYVVGDYADETDAKNPLTPVTNQLLENLRHTKEGTPNKNIFNTRNKIVLNYTKGLYYEIEDNEPFKLFLLCSIGNGKGGGDYVGVASNECGKWFGDHIKIIDKREFDPSIWEHYEVVFDEC